HSSLGSPKICALYRMISWTSVSADTAFLIDAVSMWLEIFPVAKATTAISVSSSSRDYYVRYDSTQSTIPIEEVAATGWGEEFEDEDTPTTKFMVREQETTDSSESEWENPFAAKSGGNQESCFHLKEDEELPYPRF
ncbi:hypothetical protein Tco_1535627, partial [Tanacetum coccineum]